jgi:hypothetical protein
MTLTQLYKLYSRKDAGHVSTVSQAGVLYVCHHAHATQGKEAGRLLLQVSHCAGIPTFQAPCCIGKGVEQG